MDSPTWTRALTMGDLYVISSSTTDEQTRREALAEIDRRDALDDMLRPDPETVLA